MSQISFRPRSPRSIHQDHLHGWFWDLLPIRKRSGHIHNKYSWTILETSHSNITKIYKTQKTQSFFFQQFRFQFLLKISCYVLQRKERVTLRVAQRRGASLSQPTPPTRPLSPEPLPSSVDSSGGTQLCNRKCNMPLLRQSSNSIWTLNWVRSQPAKLVILIQNIATTETCRVETNLPKHHYSSLRNQIESYNLKIAHINARACTYCQREVTADQYES